MTCLVTGGGGFLGSCIVRMLHARGDRVMALGRHPYPELESKGISTIQADITDGEQAYRAFRGVDVVFHVAGLAGIWGRREVYWRINVEGTRHVIEACRAQGIRRLIYTSTPSVVFGLDDICGGDEAIAYPAKFLTHYAASKAEAERMVLAANGPDLATVALRPHLIFGPGDPHLLPRVVQRARSGQLIQVGHGENLVDVTYVDNAAHAHVLAADELSGGARCAGKAYFISHGVPVVFWPWLNQLMARVGAPKATRRISYSTAYCIGAVLESAYRALHLPGEPRMTRFMANVLAKSHYFDISAARTDFGYEPVVTMEEGEARWVTSFEKWVR